MGADSHVANEYIVHLLRHEDRALAPMVEGGGYSATARHSKIPTAYETVFEMQQFLWRSCALHHPLSMCCFFGVLSCGTVSCC